MNQKANASFLEKEVGLLVEHFGADRVRAALAKASNGAVETSDGQTHRASSRPNGQAAPSVASMLEEIRQTDEEKHRMLADFYRHLKEKKVLPESQDIHHFAQIIGLKEISGKSRKDMIPRLMRFMLEEPNERIQIDIEKAANISEQQRQQGFSILTAKLLGDKS